MACGCVDVTSSIPERIEHFANGRRLRSEYFFVITCGESASLLRYIALSDSLDIPTENLKDFVAAKLKEAVTKGYCFYRSAQQKILNSFWQKADVIIEGDDLLQQGLRFNLFHVMQSVGRDGKSGTGAKGLTGEGYEGHSFWDTEMYMFPVMLLTAPDLARAMLDYRCTMLPQARERAHILGHMNGALFPWRTINGYEASTYFPLGTAQYHINADIAWAFWQYYLVTGDENYLLKQGAEVLIETARIWADVGSFSEFREG